MFSRCLEQTSRRYLEEALMFVTKRTFLFNIMAFKNTYKRISDGNDERNLVFEIF